MVGGALCHRRGSFEPLWPFDTLEGTVRPPTYLCGVRSYLAMAQGTCQPWGVPKSRGVRRSRHDTTHQLARRGAARRGLTRSPSPLGTTLRQWAPSVER
eukprot:scaffold998_cov411-Prasinococcus_capsulatus_cf.AAC.19